VFPIGNDPDWTVCDNVPPPNNDVMMRPSTWIANGWGGHGRRSEQTVDVLAIWMCGMEVLTGYPEAPNDWAGTTSRQCVINSMFRVPWGPD
jgi:hypothetical protein